MSLKRTAFDDNATGGFVSNKRPGGDKYHRKVSSHRAAVDPADLAAARERWAGIPPMEVAREIAAALPDDLAAALLAQFGPAPVEIQEVLVGELTELNFNDLRTAIASGLLTVRIEQLKAQGVETAETAVA